eukprot:TRINITY_DN8486_c0_g1_i1.p1 TRINITY_DN8486_c0_g1~~TRINITY_DN8486_c0_g1_i1.p1  ORF type:complete len:551 (+),score=124.15 TRINITY_DN8486_c0_g1_i1:124-1776(+)
MIGRHGEMVSVAWPPPVPGQQLVGQCFPGGCDVSAQFFGHQLHLGQQQFFAGQQNQLHLGQQQIYFGQQQHQQQQHQQQPFHAGQQQLPYGGLQQLHRGAENTGLGGPLGVPFVAAPATAQTSHPGASKCLQAAMLSACSSLPEVKAVGDSSSSSAGAGPLAARTVIPGRFYGTVKSYNPEKGFGFVACSQTLPIFNRDIFVHRREMERSQAPVSVAVSFFVELNGEGHPQARNMQLLPELLGQQLGISNSGDAGSPGETTTANLPAGMLAQAKFTNIELSGMGGELATSNSTTDVSMGPTLAAGLRAGGVSADSVRQTLCKLFPLGTGGQEAVSEFAKVQAAKSDKMMAEFLGVQAKAMGDSGNSDDMMEQQQEYSRYAAALQLQFAAAVAQCSDGQPEPSAKPWQSGLEMDSDGRPKKTMGAFVGHDPGRRYFGHITKWLDEEGFGFVRCPESQKVYGKDIFLHKAQIGQEADLYKQRTKMTINNGNKVSFTVEIQRGMPRAKDVVLEDLKDTEPVEKENQNLYERRGRDRDRDREREREREGKRGRH